MLNRHLVPSFQTPLGGTHVLVLTMKAPLRPSQEELCSLDFTFLKEIKKSRRQLRVFLLWNTSIFILMCVCVKLQWFNLFKCVITYFMKLAVLLCSSVLKQN